MNKNAQPSGGMVFNWAPSHGEPIFPCCPSYGNINITSANCVSFFYRGVFVARSRLLLRNTLRSTNLARASKVISADPGA